MIAIARRWFYTLSVALGVAVGVTPWIILSYLWPRMPRNAAIAGWYHRGLLPLLGVKVVVENHSDVDMRQNFLVMANHQSWLDICLLLGWVKPVAFISKKEVFRFPILGFGMRRIRCIAVDRGNKEANSRLADQMIRNIAEGYSYCIYPEGTRTADGKIGRFKRGSFHMVAGQRIPLLPVTIDGAFQVMPKNRPGLYPGTIRLVIHPPISADEVASLEPNALMQKVDAAVRSGMGDAARVAGADHASVG